MRQKSFSLNSFLPPMEEGPHGFQHQAMDRRVSEDIFTTQVSVVDPLEFFPLISNSTSQRDQLLGPDIDFQKICDVLDRDGLYSDQKWRFDQVRVRDENACVIDNPSVEQRTAALFNEVFKAALHTNAKWQPFWSLYAWRSHAESMIQGLRKPDVIFVNKNLQHKGPVLFRDIIMYCEVKKQVSELDTAQRQQVEMAGLVTASQANRRFVIGCCLCGSQLQLALYIRGAIIYSQRFDIHREPLLFIKVLLNLSFVDSACHGFDENFIDLGNGYFELYVKGLKVHVTPVKLFQSVSIKGRGTKVSLCSKLGSSEKCSYVLKDSWLPEGTNDIDIHEHLITQDPKPFANEEEASIFGESDTFGIFRDCLHNEDVWDYTKNLPGIPVIAASEMPNCCNPSRNPLSQDGDSSADTTQNILSRFTNTLTYEPRFHIRVLSKTCGTSLAWFSCRREFLNGLMCAIAGHFNGLRKNVLHSDISDTNVWFMVSNPDIENVIPDWPQDGAYTKRAGILGDWGLAEIRDPSRYDNLTGTVTGTYPFLAAELLSPKGLQGQVRHEVHHDLESFFWLLWITCVNLSGPYLKRRLWNSANKGRKQTNNSSDSQYPTWESTFRMPLDDARGKEGVPAWATPGVHGCSTESIFAWKREPPPIALLTSLSPYFSLGDVGDIFRDGLNRLRDHFRWTISVSTESPKDITATPLKPTITHEIFIRILRDMRDAIPASQDCPTEEDIIRGRQTYEKLKSSNRGFDAPVMSMSPYLPSQSRSTSGVTVPSQRTSCPSSGKGKRRRAQTNSRDDRSTSRRRVVPEAIGEIEEI